MPHRLSAPTIGRAVLGTATVLFLVIALLLRDDPRWYVAAGTAGVFWTLWDLVWSHVLAPLGRWIVQAFSGGLAGPPPNVRPTLEDTIRLLESHVAGKAARGVQLQAAIRLEEIYRMVKKDPGRARDVIRRMRDRFPDAVELRRYE